MNNLDDPSPTAGPTAIPGGWSEDHHLSRPSAALPILGAAFAAGVLLTTRPGRGLVRGVLRTAILLARPTLLAGGLYKLGELSAFSRTRPSAPTLIP